MIATAAPGLEPNPISAPKGKKETLLQVAVDAAILTEHLALARKAVSSRPTHPVLANLLLVAEDGKLTISGFDLSIGIAVTCDCDVTVPGRVTLPAKLLYDLVSRQIGVINLVSDTECRTTIETLSARYEIHGLTSDQFPELPEIDKERFKPIELPVEIFQSALQGVLFAVSSDETKQALTGVCITIDAQKLELGATDGHRLAVVETSVEDLVVEPITIIVPAKALQELIKLMSKQQPATVNLEFDESQIRVKTGNFTLYSRLLEGLFPNYQQLIPRQFSREITVDRKMLLAAIDRISVLAQQSHDVITFSFNPEHSNALISTDARDVGNGREAVAATITGIADELKVSFNVNYVKDALKAFTTADAQISCNTSTSPAIFTPIGGMRHLVLLMPIQIRRDS